MLHSLRDRFKLDELKRQFSIPICHRTPTSSIGQGQSLRGLRPQPFIHSIRMHRFVLLRTLFQDIEPILHAHFQVKMKIGQHSSLFALVALLLIGIHLRIIGNLKSKNL